METFIKIVTENSFQFVHPLLIEVISSLNLIATVTSILDYIH
jgi:hypothetical protein